MLEETAATLAMPGRGLLASDESTGTIGKRLEKAGLQNDEVSMRLSTDCFRLHEPLQALPALPTNAAYR